MKTFQEFKQFGLTASDEQQVIGGCYYYSGSRYSSYSSCYGSSSYYGCSYYGGRTYSSYSYNNCCYNWCGTSTETVESTPEPTPIPEAPVRDIVAEGGGA